MLAYVAFILVKSRFRVPQTTPTALLGGTLYGLFAGVFGVGGAVRGALVRMTQRRGALERAESLDPE